MSPVLAIRLREQRRAFVGWAIGLAALSAMYSAFFPSIRDSAGDLQRYMQSLPESIRSLIGNDISSPAGYLRSETFSSLGPILMLVFAIGLGSKAIAGEEEAGTLDLVLSTPVTRAHVLFESWSAMVLTSSALVAVLAITIAVVGPLFELTVPVADLLAMCLMLLLLALSFGSISLALGCATGHRGIANGVTGAIAIATYVLNVLATSVDALAPLRPISPFRWYLEPDPLVAGITPVNVAVLLAIIVCSLIVGWVTFERRDLQA